MLINNISTTEQTLQLQDIKEKVVSYYNTYFIDILMKFSTNVRDIVSVARLPGFNRALFARLSIARFTHVSIKMMSYECKN